MEEQQIELNKKTEQQQNPWDDVGGTYVKLEKDKAKHLLLVNWKIEKVKKFKDEEASKKAGRVILKEQMEFTADVLSEDGKPCNKIFSTTSINALLGLKEIFSLRKGFDPVLIRIKKIGEGVKTVYDVEEQRLNK